MATSSLSFLLLPLLAGAASACPCTTLFYNSATTTTYYPYNALLRNPNPNSLFRNQKPHYLTLIFTSTTTYPFSDCCLSVYIDSDTATSFGDNSKSSLMMTSSDFPLKFYSSVSSSIRKHTKDIMSVIGALLFGVGYGALPTAITYFVWPLLK